MQERPKAIQRLIQSPTVSVLMALIAMGPMLYNSNANAFITSLLSAAVAALMVSQIKARVMYRGAYFPFLGIYMLAQAALFPNLTGIILTCTAVLAITALLICFNQPEATRVFFVVYLICGIGALFDRSYSLLAVLLLVTLILVRAFSARGLVACMLGFITPAIIVLPLNILDYNDVIVEYSERFMPGYTIPLIAIGGIAFVSGISTFLPSYSYPARSRARNMAILGLTLGAITLPFLDFANAEKYTGLLNVCMAYNVCHFSSLKRFGWLYIIVIWLAIGALIFVK